MQKLLLFLVGAIGYGLIEILWRGYTHWTMLVLGGFCFMIIIDINNFVNTGFIMKCLLCSAAITAAEFVVGLIVNVFLKWNVWDYGNMAFNLMGQICLPYSVLWAFLSGLIIVVRNVII